MKTSKRIYVSSFVVCLFFLMVNLTNNYEPADFPKKGTLVDKYLFWEKRSKMFRSRSCMEGNESSRRIDWAEAEDCTSKAEYYRNLHNQEIAVNLWRSLITVSSGSETAKYFQNEYDAHKL